MTNDQSKFDLTDPDKISLEFSCIRASQPIGDLFIASIPYKLLMRISYFDVRRVLQTERDVERYLARIMHHTTLFCRSCELTRADVPSGGIGVRTLVMQRPPGSSSAAERGCGRDARSRARRS
jgi:uncharacterized protein (DUF885 family)